MGVDWQSNQIYLQLGGGGGGAAWHGGRPQPLHAHPSAPYLFLCQWPLSRLRAPKAFSTSYLNNPGRALPRHGARGNCGPLAACLPACLAGRLWPAHRLSFRFWLVWATLLVSLAVREPQLDSGHLRSDGHSCLGKLEYLTPGGDASFPAGHAKCHHFGCPFTGLGLDL